MGAFSNPQDSSKPWPSSAAEQVQDTASATTDAIKDRARHIAEQQKAAGADQIEGVARAVDAAADQLKGQMPTAAKYIDEVAGQVSAMASALRERSVDDIFGNVAGYARRRPVLFFAGALAAGFALSRFAKSSADRGS
jgi:flagellar hook-associated protein FlgK